MTFIFALLISVNGWFPGSFCYGTLTKLIEIKVHWQEDHRPNLVDKRNNQNHQARLFSKKFRIWTEADKINKTYVGKHVSELNCKSKDRSLEEKREEGWKKQEYSLRLLGGVSAVASSAGKEMSMALSRCSVPWCIFLISSQVSWIENHLEKLTWDTECLIINKSCSKIWQPTPAFLPGKSHGERSLVGYSPQGPQNSQTQLSN